VTNYLSQGLAGLSRRGEFNYPMLLLVCQSQA